MKIPDTIEIGGKICTVRHLVQTERLKKPVLFFDIPRIGVLFGFRIVMDLTVKVFQAGFDLETVDREVVLADYELKQPLVVQTNSVHFAVSLSAIGTKVAFEFDPAKSYLPDLRVEWHYGVIEGGLL